METVATVITDHLAVVLRMVWEGPLIRRGRGYWKMNVMLFKEKSFREETHENWGQWRTNNKYYSNTVEWWVKAVKQQVHKLFTCVGSEKHQEDRDM
jgi:hypothetical protein